MKIISRDSHGADCDRAEELTNCRVPHYKHEPCHNCEDPTASNTRKTKMPTHPSRPTIRKVVEYLESIGLNVYGPCIDLNTGYQIGNNMDYDAEQVLRYQHLKRLYPDMPFTDPEDEQ